MDSPPATDPRSHKVFHYIPEAMTTIIEASITYARLLGHTTVEPLLFIDRIMEIHYGILCRACLYRNQGNLRCKALKLCISLNITRNPVTRTPDPPLSSINRVTRPDDPPLANVLLFGIRLINNSPSSGGWDSPMRDVEKMFVYLLHFPSVQTVIEDAGFSITVIRNNVLDRGTMFNCT